MSWQNHVFKPSPEMLEAFKDYSELHEDFGILKQSTTISYDKKICNCCGESKSLINFQKCGKKKQWLRQPCNQCIKLKKDQEHRPEQPYSNLRKCNKCLRFKFLNDFNKNRGHCKACQSESRIENYTLTKKFCRYEGNFKKCATCSQVKSIDDFYAKKSIRKSGKTTMYYEKHCKRCKNLAVISRCKNRPS